MAKCQWRPAPPDLVPHFHHCHLTDISTCNTLCSHHLVATSTCEWHCNTPISMDLDRDTRPGPSSPSSSRKPLPRASSTDTFPISPLIRPTVTSSKSYGTVEGEIKSAHVDNSRNNRLNGDGHRPSLRPLPTILPLAIRQSPKNDNIELQSPECDYSVRSAIITDSESSSQITDTASLCRVHEPMDTCACRPI